MPERHSLRGNPLALIAALKACLAKGKTKFRRAGAQGSSRIEVYLDRTSDKLRILWPKNLNVRSTAYKLLNPFFSNSGELLSDPVDAVPAIEREINEAKAPVRNQIRISSHIDAWVQQRQQQHLRTRARSAFEKDVSEGKRSLDIVKTQLYPYQQQGMLHLAFTERALLADEMGLGKTVQAVAACELLRRLRGVERVLVISPASLKTEWEEQIGRFTDLPSLIIYGTRATRQKLYRKPAFFYLCNYEQILVDGQTVNVDLFIVTESKANMREVSQSVQREVARAMRQIVGMEVKAVNVHIDDVVFKPPVER